MIEKMKLQRFKKCNAFYYLSPDKTFAACVSYDTLIFELEICKNGDVELYFSDAYYTSNTTRTHTNKLMAYLMQAMGIYDTYFSEYLAFKDNFNRLKLKLKRYRNWYDVPNRFIAYTVDSSNATDVWEFGGYYHDYVK